MSKLQGSDIEKIFIFKDLDEKAKISLIEKERIIKLDKKQILFHEKQELKKVYFLLEGKVTIFKISENGERKVIFILSKGEMINEPLIDNNTTTVGCEAFEKATILEYNTEDLLEILKYDFNLTKNLISYLERRSRRLYRQLKNSTSIKVDKKLAAKLYRISKEFGKVEGEWTYLDLNLSITYIADMLGCKRETLSRAMKTLQDEGIVKVRGKKLYTKEKDLSKYFKGLCQNKKA